MHRLSLAVFKDNIPENNILPTWGDMESVLCLIPSMTSRGPWLVGGTVRRVMMNQIPTTDFDIMFKNEGQFDDFCGAMRERGATTKHESPQQITFDLHGGEIQAIRAAFYPTLIQTLNSFDFTLCQFGYDGTDFVWGDTAAEDVRANKLVFTHTTDPVATMRRMFKYAAQGFYMDSSEIGRFLKAMTKQEADIDKSKEKWTDGKFSVGIPLPSYANGGTITPPFPHPPLPLGYTGESLVVNRSTFNEMKQRFAAQDIDYRQAELRILGNHTVDIFPLFGSTKVIVSDSI